jgi:hypothetical protein
MIPSATMNPIARHNPPISFRAICKEAISQNKYPHNNNPKALLKVYPRSGNAGSKRNARGKIAKPTNDAMIYHRMKEIIIIPDSN